MSMCVMDLDLVSLPDSLDLPSGHDGAAILVRINGRVAGQAIVARRDIQGPDKPLDLILRYGSCSIWDAWLRYKLGLSSLDHVLLERPSGTIAICTRDRPDDLELCLRGLKELINPIPVVVIDNAPASSATRNVVARFPDVQYVLEPRPGLDNARNTAIAQSQGEVIAFIDDDARPDPFWFERLIDGFQDPMVMAVTGLTLAAELETDAQAAFQALGGLSRGFWRCEYDLAQCDPFFAWQAGAGANMALRRQVFDLIGTFDPALDAGTKSLAGGDFDMFRRIIKAGFVIVYEPQAVNWHRHRRTMDELRHQIFSYEAGALAIATKVLLRERDPAAVTFVVGWVCRQFSSLLRSLRHRKRDVPFNIAMAQLRGAMSGPWRYFRAMRWARHA